jgi:two-component system, NtrC family, response regulator AtoC
MLFSGDFREDLYYRLKVIELTVPPLRERRDEIPALTDYFVARYSHKYKRPATPISDELRQLFQHYDWQGNIRELENMIKRSVILQDEQLVIREIQRQMQRMAAARAVPVAAPAAVGVPAAVGASIGSPGGSGSLPGYGFVGAEAPEPEPGGDTAVAVEEAGGSLAAVAKAASLKAERAAIEQTLRQVHWNRRKAAQNLGVSYKTLLNKIKECGISRA